MTKIFLTFFIFISLNSFSQVKKDTIPSKYVITMDSSVFRQVNEILQKSYNALGKQLYFEEADKLRSELAAVINFLLAEVAKQKQPAIKPKN